MPPTRLTQQSQTTEELYANTLVVKRLRASQGGAIKWARRYGDSLVCVRYRHDAQEQHRYTTVELVVDDAPLARNPYLDQPVMIRIEPHETELHNLVRTHGAKWDGKLRLWCMRRRIAKRLRLLSRLTNP